MATDNIQESPILIVGAPRSGTTWLQRLLLSIPQFCGSQESNFFVHFGQILRSFDVSGRPRRPGLSNYWKEEDMVNEIRRLWSRTVNPVVQTHPHANWLVEKTPRHILFVQEIARILPNARFVQMIRDSRAVTASLLHASSSWGERWAPRNLSTAIDIWKRSVEAGLRAKDVLMADRYYQVYYERLMSDTLHQLAGVLKFVGTQATTPVLEKVIEDNSFENQKAIGGTPLPLYGEHQTIAKNWKEPEGFFWKGRVDSWKTSLSPVHRALVWRKTKDLMTRLGYDKSGNISVD